MISGAVDHYAVVEIHREAGALLALRAAVVGRGRALFSDCAHERDEVGQLVAQPLPESNLELAAGQVFAEVE